MNKFLGITKLVRSSPEFNKWNATTEAVLKGAFGSLDNIADKFQAHSSVAMNMSDAYYQGEFVKRMERKQAILESAIEQLELLTPSIIPVAVSTYQLHPEIERVSEPLFKGGHYKQAAFEAYIRVIDEVKRRSGLNLDGDSLMNHAFGFDNGRTPVLKFNSLATDEEKDEQKGFMFLFKGVVSLRNSKAHTNRMFNDPMRAHDYLSLASLLMRVLEELAQNTSTNP